MKKEADKLENKSTLEIYTANACSRGEARKHVSERVTIGFGLVWRGLAVMPTKINNVKYFRHG